MGNNYLNQLQDVFEKNRDEENAHHMKKYMRGKFEFLGIKTPLRREISKPFLRKENLPRQDDLEPVIRELWGLPCREYQYLAISILRKTIKEADRKIITLLEWLIVNKSWWDTVDGIASWLVGEYFVNYPDQIDLVTGKWIESDNIWLQRTAILFQLSYKDNTDLNLLFKYIGLCSDSKEFFIQKAIGWILREYSKTDPDAVIEYLNNHNLAPLSRREALKVINRQKKL